MEFEIFIYHSIYSLNHIHLLKKFLVFLKKLHLKVWPKHFENEGFLTSLINLFKSFESTETNTKKTFDYRLK